MIFQDTALHPALGRQHSFLCLREPRAHLSRAAGAGFRGGGVVVWASRPSGRRLVGMQQALPTGSRPRGRGHGPIPTSDSEKGFLVESRSPARSCSQYSNTRKTISRRRPTATSKRRTQFGCDTLFSSWISLREVSGKPSCFSLWRITLGGAGTSAGRYRGTFPSCVVGIGPLGLLLVLDCVKSVV